MSHTFIPSPASALCLETSFHFWIHSKNRGQRLYRVTPQPARYQLSDEDVRPDEQETQETQETPEEKRLSQSPTRRRRREAKAADFALDSRARRRSDRGFC